MIVDVHTFQWDRPEQLGPDFARFVHGRATSPWDRPTGSVVALENAAKDIDVMIVLGFASRLLGAEIPHEQVARTLSQLTGMNSGGLNSGGKAIGLAGIDPMQSNWKESLQRARQLGLQGIVVSPAAQGYSPRFGPAMELLATCESLHLPVMVLSGLEFSPRARAEFADPILLDEAARSFPNLRLVLGNLASPFLGQTLSLLHRHEHVYADLAGFSGQPWRLYQTLITAHEQQITHKLLLGSNSPFATPAQCIEELLTVNRITQGSQLPTIPMAQLKAIVARDALKCLGLSTPSQAPPSATLANTTHA